MTLARELEDSLSPLDKCWLASSFARFHIKKKEWQEALDCLETAHKELATTTGDVRNTREELRNRYDEARVHYVEDKSKAKEIFASVFERSHHISWQRLELYAQNWLGRIAYDEGNFDKAHDLLEGGLTILQDGTKTRDLRRVAYYRQVLAWLYSNKSNPKWDIEIATEHAKEAHTIFNRLGMQQEEDDMKNLIESFREAT